MKGAPKQPVADQDANQRERNRRQDDERQAEAAELGHDQHVNAEDRGAERRAHVAEGHIGDLPFAVPQQRRMGFVGGLAVQADDRFRQLAPIVGVDPLGHFKHAVERRLKAAGEFRRHHIGEAAVAAEDDRASLLRSRP